MYCPFISHKKNLRKTLLMLIGVSVVFVLLLFQYNGINTYNSFQNESLIEEVLNETFINSTKFILYWTTMFERKDFYYGFGTKPFENCSYSNCYATANKDLLELERFDALMFHGSVYKLSTYNIPLYRSDHQRYIYATWESPLSYPTDMRPLNNFYNWTMTYRLDSDIPSPYGYLVQMKTDFKMPTESELKKKKRLVAWFVSHCNVPSRRKELVDKMRDYIEVDIYGKCGDLECERSSPKCYHMLEENYKFYLSFENSYCKDYVTEKMFTILNKTVVPIVYGFVNYKDIAPPHSVINVEDFSSIEALVEYLKYLDNNNDKYLEYFKWKRDYYVLSSFKYFICDLCEKLNTDLTPKTYENIEEWWNGVDGSVCKTNEKLPKIIPF